MSNGPSIRSLSRTDGTSKFDHQAESKCVRHNLNDNLFDDVDDDGNAHADGDTEATNRRNKYDFTGRAKEEERRYKEEQQEEAEEDDEVNPELDAKVKAIEVPTVKVDDIAIGLMEMLDKVL